MSAPRTYDASKVVLRFGERVVPIQRLVPPTRTLVTLNEAGEVAAIEERIDIRPMRLARGRARYEASVTLTPEDEGRHAREQGAIAAAVEGVIS